MQFRVNIFKHLNIASPFLYKTIESRYLSNRTIYVDDGMIKYLKVNANNHIYKKYVLISRCHIMWHALEFDFKI